MCCAYWIPARRIRSKSTAEQPLAGHPIQGPQPGKRVGDPLHLAPHLVTESLCARYCLEDRI